MSLIEASHGRFLWNRKISSKIPDRKQGLHYRRVSSGHRAGSLPSGLNIHSVPYCFRIGSCESTRLYMNLVVLSWVIGDRVCWAKGKIRCAILIRRCRSSLTGDVVLEMSLTTVFCSNYKQLLSFVVCGSIDSSCRLHCHRLWSAEADRVLQPVKSTLGYRTSETQVTFASADRLPTLLRTDNSASVSTHAVLRHGDVPAASTRYTEDSSACFSALLLFSRNFPVRSAKFSKKCSRGVHSWRGHNSSTTARLHLLEKTRFTANTVTLCIIH